MTSTLPPPVQHKLEQVLAQWRHWQGDKQLPGAPHIIERLQGGLSNYSVIAEAAGHRYVLRIDGANPGANGLNRQAEWRALQSAHKSGIGPQPRYFNPEIGAMVCDYLPPDEDQSLTASCLAELLVKIHALPALHFRLDPLDRMRRYERQLAGAPSSAAERLLALAPAVHKLVASAPPVANVCHHDLNRANLLRSNGKLYALDWEYCAMGDPWFDLAVIIDDRQSSTAEANSLLCAYLGRTATAPELSCLHRQLSVVRYLELLWYASGQSGDRGQVDIDAKIVRLQRGLELNPGNY